MFVRSRIFHHMLVGMIILELAILSCGFAANTQVDKSGSKHNGVIYRNPRVYNVEYSFEMLSDPNKINREKDLKLWLPIPREWDSQKAVKIVSVEPEPHGKYVDPEYGNHMIFWDFGQKPNKLPQKVNVKFRLEAYEIRTEVDPNKIGTYDKASEEYVLYTRSTHSVSITPKIKEMAEIAVGDEENPYLQARRIFQYTRKKMRYKILDFERGRGIKCLLDFPTVDEKTGEEYYTGCCSQYTALFVALCRSVGIPARSVFGYIRWRPWINEENSTLLYKFETKLSPDGYSGSQHYNGLLPHMWGEFYIPGYGWIPIDANMGLFGYLSNETVITNKGRDIKIGPHAPQKDHEGYGSQWVPLHNGRADYLFSAVWNIAKIHTAKVKVFHHLDPFPADAFAAYMANLYPPSKTDSKAKSWRTGILRSINNSTLGGLDEKEALTEAYEKNPRAKHSRDAYICHMLRKVVGDKKFFIIYDTYTSLRVTSGAPVSTKQFVKVAEDVHGKPLNWFFAQWLERNELPELKLADIDILKDGEKWRIQGNLCQLNNSVFRIPVELEIETVGEKVLKKIWMEMKNASFEYDLSKKPNKIIVDPKYHILKIQKMPLILEELWNLYPELLVVYGTLSEEQANQTAAKRFNKEYLGLEDKIIKADVDVNEADLNTKCLVLFGRPETNKIAQKFKDIFPIKFNGNEFAWNGTTYNKPTQGIALIAGNPKNPRSLVIMYVGLGAKAIQTICDQYLYDAAASYVIYEDDKVLLRGDWEVESGLMWKPDS